MKGDIQNRCRERVIQICDVEDVRILKGGVSKDRIHMHVEPPPKLSLSDLVKRLKGHKSRRLQDECPDLKKRYWSRFFMAIRYGVWSTGNIADEMVQEYLEPYRGPSNSDTGSIILG